MTTRILTLLALFLSFGLSSCAQTDKVSQDSQQGITLDSVDEAQKQLKQRAAVERERNVAAANQLEVGLPPGVEPGALTLRDSTDPKAFLELAEAVADVIQRSPLADSTQSNEIEVDKKDRAEALKLYATARNAALDGRHLIAITELLKAQKLDPTSAEILRELARSYRSVGSVSRAVELYEELIELEPDNSEALFTVGMSWANRRDFTRAIAALSRLPVEGKSFTHDPAADTMAHFALALSLRELGYDEASIEAARVTVEIPEHINIQTNYGAQLGSIYRQRGETWRLIGDTYCRLGQFQEALDAYEQSASLHTSDPTALYPRVIYANLRLGRIYNAQYELFAVVNATPLQVSEQVIHLCDYVNSYAQPTKLLAESIRAIYHNHPDKSGLLRAAASLLPPDHATVLLKEFVDRRPRDLEGVQDLLRWLAERDTQAAVQLVVTLAGAHADLADDYIDRLAVVLSPQSTIMTTSRELDPSPARALLESRVLAKLGALGEAWSVCAQARKQWPNDQSLAVRQVRLAAALQERLLFQNAFSGVGEVDQVWAFIKIAQAARNIGDVELALQYAQLAADREPENVDAILELARVHIAQAASLAGNPDNAPETKFQAETAARYAELALSLEETREETYTLLLSLYGTTGLLADFDQFQVTRQRLQRAIPNSALYRRLDAQQSIAQRRYEQALDILLNLYDADPTDHESLSQAVTAWERWERLDSAQNWLNSQLEKHPGDPALLEQWMRVQVLRDRTDRVIDRFEEMLAKNKNDYVVRRLLENVFRATGQHDSALPLGEARLLARPQGFQRELELAALYARAELAHKVLDRIKWIHNHSADATLQELTRTVAIAGQLPDHVTERDSLMHDLVMETVGRFPDAPFQVYGEGLRSLARLDRSMEEFDAFATETSTRIAESVHALINADENAQQQQEAQLFHEIAQSLVNDGNVAEAARFLRTRLDIAPEPATALLWTIVRMIVIADAASSAKTDTPDEAELYAQKTIELIHDLNNSGKLAEILGAQRAPRVSDLFFESGVLFGMFGDGHAGIRVLRETLVSNPTHAMAMNNIGYSRIELDYRDEQTLQWIQQAHTLSPDDPSILDTIGWLRYKQGQLEDALGPRGDGPPIPGALSLIQRSFELSSQPNAEVLDHLGDLHWRMGNRDEAVSAWEQVVDVLSDTAFYDQMIQNYLIRQTQLWPLLVADPEVLFDQNFGVILKRAQSKLEAVEQGDQPSVAPTFDEIYDQKGAEARR